MQMKPLSDARKLNAIAASVALSGLLTLSSALFSFVHLRRFHLVVIDERFTVLAGLSLVYLAMLLRRGKRSAWSVAVAVYLLLVARNTQHFLFSHPSTSRSLFVLPATLNLAIPIITLAALVVSRSSFIARSEPRSFATAVRRSGLILAVAFLYGFIGFQLFDASDFRTEIPPLQAAHYTVDQLGLTTHNQPIAHTRRSDLFIDSLASISIASLLYIGLSFFAPIRFRLKHNQKNYESMQKLVKRYAASSEDFFKLWPRDKNYFFSKDRSSALAYRVTKGTALVAGDPAGPKGSYPELIKDFGDYCRLNDWSPAFIHTQPDHLKTYKKLGFEVQKIGEEAIVDTANFMSDVATSKYFRQILNRFERLSYSCEVLNPPHSQEVLRRLRQVSKEWLRLPGRTERRFIMGYFSEPYLQQCVVMVARDSQGVIQAFINEIPILKSQEASYDFLRNCAASPGNVNDYLMVNFISYLDKEGIPSLNMGLSPLAGLHRPQHSNKLGGVLDFIYHKSGRFYSFKGLARFKSKYQPQWQPRYVAYLGGPAGFSKAMNALLRAMAR